MQQPLVKEWLFSLQELLEQFNKLNHLQSMNNQVTLKEKGAIPVMNEFGV